MVDNYDEIVKLIQKINRLVKMQFKSETEELKRRYILEDHKTHYSYAEYENIFSNKNFLDIFKVNPIIEPSRLYNTREHFIEFINGVEEELAETYEMTVKQKEEIEDILGSRISYYALDLIRQKLEVE